MSIKRKVNELLTQVAEEKGFSDFEILTDENVIRGDGFLSEFYTGSVRDKKTGKIVEAYIKLPPQVDIINIKDLVFKNEYLYYSTVYPTLANFQKEKGINELFDNIPVFYCGSVDGLALENLIKKHFILYDKTKYLDEMHLKAIFELYGRYHALTFSYKDQNTEIYDNIVSKVKDVFKNKDDRNQLIMTSLFKTGYECIKEVDKEKASKLIKLYEDPEYAQEKGTFYTGKYSTLTHGDCWSNNMMFRYKENGDIADIKLVDHQLLRDSTPIHDLSYFFYSGASKEDFEKLDYYLDLYYKSFCKFATLLGSDPEQLLPYDSLKADWNKYSFFGVRMGIMVWQAKLLSKAKIAEACEGNVLQNIREQMLKVRESEEFRSKIRDILLHAIDRNII